RGVDLVAERAGGVAWHAARRGEGRVRPATAGLRERRVAVASDHPELVEGANAERAAAEDQVGPGDEAHRAERGVRIGEEGCEALQRAGGAPLVAAGVGALAAHREVPRQRRLPARPRGEGEGLEVAVLAERDHLAELVGALQGVAKAAAIADEPAIDDEGVRGG